MKLEIVWALPACGATVVVCPGRINNSEGFEGMA